jgi:AraC-like DNA-binding protein
MPGYAIARLGVQRHHRGELTARHRHAAAYAAIVLGGGYEEAGEGGRQRVAAGTVTLHGPFDAHQNLFSGNGAEVLNLDLPASFLATSVTGHCENLDAVVKLAHVDGSSAAQWLLSAFEPTDPPDRDWPEMLAAALIETPHLCISEWAGRHKLAPAVVSRNFRQVFGVPPQRFRAEARARHAWLALVGTEVPLVGIALELGFVDQAHFTHSVVALTGDTPGSWRRRASTAYKTARLDLTQKAMGISGSGEWSESFFQIDVPRPVCSGCGSGRCPSLVEQQRYLRVREPGLFERDHRC